MGTLVSWAKKDQIPQFAWLLVIYKSNIYFLGKKKTFGVILAEEDGEEELLDKLLLILDYFILVSKLN